MPYTLGKVFVWYLLSGLVGLVIGWTLHHILRCSQKSHGAAASVATDTSELDRLRARVANLEPAVQDRDRLRAEVAELKAAADTKVATPVAAFAGVTHDDHSVVVAERDHLRSLVASHEATISGHEATISAHQDKVGQLQGLLDSAAAGPAAPDVAGATAVLGRAITLDDLKVVEGIGPKIEELCHAKGIRTWWGLANTAPTVLREMLDEAGSRFQMHDPSSWPSQAGMLAHGRWAEFKVFTDSLDGGRAE